MAISQIDMVQVTKSELLRAVKASVFAAGTRLMGVSPKAKIEVPITIYDHPYTATVYIVVVQDDDDVQWVALKVTSYNTRDQPVFIKVLLSNDSNPVMTVVQNIAHGVGSGDAQERNAFLLSSLANMTSH